MMASLSIYFFWSGIIASSLASLSYLLYTTSGSLLFQRFKSFFTKTQNPLPLVRKVGIGRLSTIFGLITTFLLAGAVASRAAAVKHAPISDLYEYTVAFAFMISLIYLVFETTTHQRRIGSFVFPIVVSLLAIATAFPSDVIPLIPALQNGPLLTLHVSVMIASYSVLTVAFSAACIYLIQGGGESQRFKSLTSAENAGDFAHKAILIGFPLLALGISLGAWWANSAWGRYWGWDPKETSALIVLLSLAAYFHAKAGDTSLAGAPIVRRFVPSRWRRGKRPDPVWWIVVSFALLLFSYFGVNLWISGLHSYAGV